ncbi:hypothetical protein PCANC_25927 [Puccinia coronata f. sp. avenae]|jgi:superfamily II RNA helicase|uniref:Uncharacterized protein n=1 Tax=Puccinia coronata f. sp. avenae TaxID=200324 RepID=A0A2N5TJQ4_9BASI|nr:hypothetical protein PCANC_25927 [Puccinia coronata f. sp. avenae]
MAKRKRQKHLTIPSTITQLDDERLEDHVRNLTKMAFPGDEPKPLQVKAVAILARCRNTFLMAGTGFGKSRVAEMYHKLFK